MEEIGGFTFADWVENLSNKNHFQTYYVWS